MLLFSATFTFLISCQALYTALDTSRTIDVSCVADMLEWSAAFTEYDRLLILQMAKSPLLHYACLRRVCFMLYALCFMLYHRRSDYGFESRSGLQA